MHGIKCLYKRVETWCINDNIKVFAFMRSSTFDQHAWTIQLKTRRISGAIGDKPIPNLTHREPIY